MSRFYGRKNNPDFAQYFVIFICKLENSCLSYYILLLKNKCLKKNLIYGKILYFFSRIFLGKICETKIMTIEFRMSVKMIYRA